MGNPALNWCGDGCFEDYATRICLTGNYSMHNTPGSANPSDPSQSFSGKLEENNTCRNSINNSWATSAECGFYSYTVSNLGLLLHFSISMIVRTLMWSRSANAFCVKCCRFRSARSFHANKSSGLFTAHRIYFI